jgi:hypothetical protein
MKKDKEWLKEEITEILLTSKKDGTNYFYYRDLKEKIYNAIDQLNLATSRISQRNDPRRNRS